MGVAIPATKAARHAMITQILSNKPIRSQEELREALKQEGIVATQATLSRDLLEMRATKIRNISGENVYSLPDVVQHIHQQSWSLEESPSYKLKRWCQELLVGGDIAGNILVLSTPVGGANLLAGAIDAAVLDDVLGCLAGDNTVIMICRSEVAANKVRDYLLKLAEPAR